MLKEEKDTGKGKGALQNNEKYVAFLSHPHQGELVGMKLLALALKTLILFIQTCGLQGLSPG